MNGYKSDLYNNRPTSMQKSPRTVPGKELEGLVSPRIIRPDLTTFVPSHTIGITGPEAIYVTNDLKNGFDDKSE